MFVKAAIPPIAEGMLGEHDRMPRPLGQYDGFAMHCRGGSVHVNDLRAPSREQVREQATEHA
jgi:hypothetical protein